MSATYDDVFRTLQNDCSGLMIPLINEVFHENYNREAQISFSQNEHFLNQQDGDEQKRVTDSSFTIRQGKILRRYHIECQSTPDSSMLVRMFEYDAQIALDEGEIEGAELTVTFPHASVLFLRCNSQTPDRMHIRIRTPEGEVAYSIPVIKMVKYTLEEIFEKKLWFLIPFYIFLHEPRLTEYNEDKKKLNILLGEYRQIKNRLEELSKTQEISEYVKCTLFEMSNKVVRDLAAKYDNVKEGVESVMGGKILEYEAKTILNKGITQGFSQGITQGISLGTFETLSDLVNDGILSLEQAADRAADQRNEFIEWYESRRR